MQVMLQGHRRRNLPDRDCDRGLERAARPLQPSVTDDLAVTRPHDRSCLRYHEFHHAADVDFLRCLLLVGEFSKCGAAVHPAPAAHGCQRRAEGEHARRRIVRRGVAADDRHSDLGSRHFLRRA